MTTKNNPLSLIWLITISLLGCSMELDISIPSFPSIMAHFSASEAQVQSTLSFNFLAFCISGLFYGPLSERYGRRSLMIYGAACFLIGALGCVFSYSIYQLTFWRFIQGLGASSTLVIGFAMISDSYNAQKAAHYIAKINAYSTIFMSVAPLLGTLLISYFSWRANFAVIAIIALIAYLCLKRYLPETHLHPTKTPLIHILKDYKFLITDKKFILLSTIPNLFVTAYLTFLANASFYYLNSCNLSYFNYGIYQAFTVLSFSLMSFYIDKAVALLGTSKALKYGVGIYIVGTLLLIASTIISPYNPAFLTFAICVCSVGAAFPMSITFARSLDLHPHLKGASSSFIMSSRLLLSSLVIALSGVFFDGSMKPVAIVYSTMIAIVLTMYLMLYRQKKSLSELQSEVVSS